MFNSTTLEAAIGLIFCYAFVALIVSSINKELISSNRGKNTALSALDENGNPVDR